MREQDVCADTVVLTRRYAEHVRQLLGDPPLDTLGRNCDHLGIERVGRRLAQHFGEPVDQPVGSLGPVDV